MPVTTVLYSEFDRRNRLCEPQFQRDRSRYRGSRESYKLNLEIAQATYDLMRLYRLVTRAEEDHANNIHTLQTDDTQVMDITVVAVDTIISQVTGFGLRIRALEEAL